MDWDITPGEVGQVLRRTADKAAGLEPIAKEFGDYAERAVRQAQATLVGQATLDVLTHYQTAWRDIMDQINASLMGAQDATMAYVEGQHEMALNAQRAAVDAPGKRRAAEAQADVRTSSYEPV